MYLNNIVIKNVGPIDNIDLELEFEYDGNPKPIILVGENGSGKSTLIGTIVDSLFEFSKQSYDDIVKINKAGKSPFFKVCSSNNIRIGESNSVSFLRFKGKNNEENFYLEKVGNISKKDCLDILNNKYNIDSLWSEETIFKNVTNNEKYFEREFADKSICYFPPDRYQQPYWINKNVVLKEELNMKSKMARELNKPIVIKDVSEKNVNWLLDIIVDSRPDVFENINGTWNVEQNLQDIKLLKIARSNTEDILSEILRKKVKFGLNWRNSRDSRFNVIDSKENRVIIPTLNSLSTGEAALFNMFSTIIRYSDYSDINKSIKLYEIEGIVIIDEVELHLHSTVQNEILPRLIRKFPKVQFIITSHSPLFIMGMKDIYGENGFTIINMPDGKKISTEEFSEFNKSYNYYKETRKYKEEIQDEIDKRVGKTLIVTEGCTDWKHLKRALEKLKQDGIYNDSYHDLEIEFLEFEDKNSKLGELKLDMGDSRLVAMCEYYSRMPQKRKIIFIGDRDTDKSKKLSQEGKKFKDWGNNIYSFQLPIPPHREKTPDICIEHYYLDEEIKISEKFMDGIERRLFMGNDFNSRGISINNDIRLICEKPKICGKYKINIIEGSSGEKVFSIDEDNDINYAMSKTRFVNNIVNGNGEFAKVGYTLFEPVFNIIKEIENI